jgi:hypothetical protein
VICATTGTGIRLLLQPIVRNHIPVVIFYPFVLIASIWGGTLAGLYGDAAIVFESDRARCTIEYVPL